jgi:hypothetical protein
MNTKRLMLLLCQVDIVSVGKLYQWCQSWFIVGQLTTIQNDKGHTIQHKQREKQRGHEV